MAHLMHSVWYCFPPISLCPPLIALLRAAHWIGSGGPAAGSAAGFAGALHTTISMVSRKLPLTHPKHRLRIWKRVEAAWACRDTCQPDTIIWLIGIWHMEHSDHLGDRHEHSDHLGDRHMEHLVLGDAHRD